MKNIRRTVFVAITFFLCSLFLVWGAWAQSGVTELKFYLPWVLGGNTQSETADSAEAQTEEELERIRQQMPAGEIIEVSGPKTRGSTLMIAGEPMKLPADVEVAHYIVMGMCVPGRKCLPLPIYVLYDVDDNAFISISAQTGEIGFADTEETSENYAELNARAAQVFQWIPALR